MNRDRRFLLTVPIFGTALALALYLPLSWHPYQTLLWGFDTTVLVAVLGIGSGLIFLILPLAIDRTDRAHRWLLVGVLAGLAVRLCLFWSDPILENDFYRYLWDGAVLAIGENPYRWSPADVMSGVAPVPLQTLASEAGGLVEQIGYPDLRTIYPPLTALFFTAAHLVDPWGFTGLRSLYLIADCGMLVLLFALLSRLDRSPIWVLVYWLNPLAVQMVYNALHMDVLLLPFLTAAILYAIRRQPFFTAMLLVLAAGIKLWPALLAVPLLRFASANGRVFLTVMSLFGIGLVLVVAPVVLSGPLDTSGLLAFSGEWRKNEIFFGLVVSSVDAVLNLLDLMRFDAERLARLLVAGGLVCLSLWPVTSLDEHGLVHRILLIVAALFIFAPSPYPWYFIWLLPFLTAVPSFALLAWTATLPLYQFRFHPAFIEDGPAFEDSIVWVEHGIPVMLLAVTFLFRLARR